MGISRTIRGALSLGHKLSLVREGTRKTARDVRRRNERKVLPTKGKENQPEGEYDRALTALMSTLNAQDFRSQRNLTIASRHAVFRTRERDETDCREDDRCSRTGDLGALTFKSSTLTASISLNFIDPTRPRPYLPSFSSNSHLSLLRPCLWFSRTGLRRTLRLCRRRPTRFQPCPSVRRQTSSG